jgi:hypothetical protein
MIDVRFSFAEMTKKELFKYVNSHARFMLFFLHNFKIEGPFHFVSETAASTFDITGDVWVHVMEEDGNKAGEYWLSDVVHDTLFARFHGSVKEDITKRLTLALPEAPRYVRYGTSS